VEVNETYNLYYTSPFAFGANAQNISLVYDTQTDWTIVLSNLCSNCADGVQVYVKALSNTSIPSNIAVSSIPFGKGNLIGDTRIDEVCVYEGTKNKICVFNEFTFFEVTSMNGIELSSNYSGILGLAPDNPSNGPSFITSMKNKGVISRRMLGMQINNSSLNSFVTYGGVTPSVMYHDSKTQEIPVYFYETSDPKSWKIDVFDLFSQN
jgi:hypothetical protein